MTSDRAYHPRLSAEAARGELRHAAGSHLDPVVVDALLEVLQDQESIPAASAAAGAAPPPPVQLDVIATIERFEQASGMGSGEFTTRYLNGDFGRAAWARTWFGLLR